VVFWAFVGVAATALTLTLRTVGQRRSKNVWNAKDE